MIKLNSYSLATDSLFLSGLLFAGLPLITDVVSELFVLIGIIMAVTSAYSHFRLPQSSYVLLFGSTVSLFGAIFGMFSFGDYESGIPVMILLLGFASSIFTIEEGVRHML